jgi:hypothetical protein
MLQTAREFWRSIVNDFRPVGQVRPEEIIRFFVDCHEDDPTRSLLQRLKLNFQNSIGQQHPYKALFTGHRGSGKSTELMRLGQELAGDFFVVWFDAETSLTETANHFEVLLGMGLAVHAAAEAADLRPNKRLTDNLLRSLAKFVRRYEERKEFSLKLEQLLKQVFAIALTTGAGAVGGPAVAIAAGAAVIGADQVFKAIRLELNVRDDLVKTLELPANRQEVIGALNNIIDGVQDKAQKLVLIITDGLDKVSSARARLLFAESTLLTEPACALVYASPIEFHHRLTAGQAVNIFDEYRMLPNPTVQRRPLTGDNWKLARNPDENGLKVMRKVISKRLTARGKIVDDMISPASLDLLARTSGGVMRELIRYVRNAVEFDQLLGKMQIDEMIAQNVVDQQRQDVSLRLTVDHREALRQVMTQGELSGGQRETVEDELLRSLHLLSYQDDIGHSWFDAHPNVLPLL